MFCKNCGHELRADSNFCGKCGQNVNIPVQEDDIRHSSDTQEMESNDDTTIAETNESEKQEQNKQSIWTEEDIAFFNGTYNPNVQKSYAPKYSQSKPTLLYSAYPPIRSTTKWDALIMLLPLILTFLFSFGSATGAVFGVFFLMPLATIWAIVYAFILLPTQKKTRIDRIRNSPEYKKQCLDFDNQCENGMFNTCNKFNDNSKYRRIKSYIITDRSIIFNGAEYSYDYIGVFSPKGPSSIVEFEINGITYSIDYNYKDKYKVFYALVKANSYFNLYSLKDKLKYAHMAYRFLDQVNRTYQKVPYIGFDPELVFKEIWYQKRMIDKTGEATDEQKFWIEKYNQVAQELDDYFKKENPIANKGYNREPETLEKTIDLMSDFDTDMNEVVGRYNRKLQIEEMERQERLERKAMEREANGSSFTGRTLSTAAGVVIGNKLSNSSKKQTEQHHYMCPLGCQFQYKVSGVPKCRLQTNNLTPDPSKCGHGRMYMIGFCSATYGVMRLMYRRLCTIFHSTYAHCSKSKT